LIAIFSRLIAILSCLIAIQRRFVGKSKARDTQSGRPKLGSDNLKIAVKAFFAVISN